MRVQRGNFKVRKSELRGQNEILWGVKINSDSEGGSHDGRKIFSLQIWEGGDIMEDCPLHPCFGYNENTVYIFFIEGRDTLGLKTKGDISKGMGF